MNSYSSAHLLHPPRSLPGSNIASFWEHCGKRVFEKYGIWWGHYKGPFYTSLPFSLKVDAGLDEIRAMLREERISGLRFPSDHLPGLARGAYVCRPDTYTLKSVSRKHRGKVTRALETCCMRQMDADELRVQGFELNRDTLERQGRTDLTFLDPAKWAGYTEAVGRTPGMRIFGAFLNGRLSTYMIACRDDGWLHLMIKMSRTEDLGVGVNHGLDFWVIQEAAKDPEVCAVHNGFTALVEHKGLDQYKRHMGYEVVPHNLCIYFHPLIAPVLNSSPALAVSHAASRTMAGHASFEYIAEVVEGARISMEKPQAEETCQQEGVPDASRLARPGALFPALRVIQTLREGGPVHMLQKAADFVGRKTASPNPAAVVRPLAEDEVLGLKAGDWVEVKPLAEIEATLDARRKNRGLLFTDEMRAYAGQRFRVHKRVESIFLEESKQRRKINNTVLLEGVYCEGRTFCCDRSCFLFWKELWLKRAEPAEKASPTDRSDAA